MWRCWFGRHVNQLVAVNDEYRHTKDNDAVVYHHLRFYQCVGCSKRHCEVMWNRSIRKTQRFHAGITIVIRNWVELGTVPHHSVLQQEYTQEQIKPVPKAQRDRSHLQVIK